MKKTIFVAALLATSSFGVMSASADNGNCGTGWCTGLPDFSQKLKDMQKAINMIVDVKDATDLVQDAVNAGNLVSVANAADLAHVWQDAGEDADQTAINKLIGGSWFSDFVDIDQNATNVVNSISSTYGVVAIQQHSDGTQKALNIVDGGRWGRLEDLAQAATNVVNTVTTNSSKTIEQANHASQSASNFIDGGTGGYDYLVGTPANWFPTGTDVRTVDTQAAVNAANLVTTVTLNGFIDQESLYNSQSALNTALINGTVYDLGQAATNVVNSVSYTNFASQTGCYCIEGWDVRQVANTDQLASNLLKATGNVTNSVQAATNVANSITVRIPATTP